MTWIADDFNVPMAEVVPKKKVICESSNRLRGPNHRSICWH